MTTNSKTVRTAFGVGLLVAVSFPMTVYSAGKGGGKKGSGDPNTDYALAFVANDAIFLTTIDGSQTKQLTAPKRKAGDFSPTWSPDLEPNTEGYQGYLGYIHRPDTDWIGANLMIMDPDGSNQRIVQSFPWTGDPFDAQPYDTNAGGKTTLAWSPNGREIVFSASGSRLIAVEVATGNWRVLLQTGLDMNDPAISPLNVLSIVSQGDVYCLNFELDAAGLIELDNASLTNLTGDGFEFNDQHATWSPRGTLLALVRYVDSSDGELRELVVLDPLLGEVTVLWSGSIFEGVHGEPTWSADGNQIAVEYVERNNSGGASVNLVRVTNWNDPLTRNVVSITQTNGTHEYEPAWKPGGAMP